MAISDDLEKLASDLSDAYDAIEAKGGTMPEHKNTDSLPTAIESIEGGGGGAITGYGRLVYCTDADRTMKVTGALGQATIVDSETLRDWWYEEGKPTRLTRSGNNWNYTVSGTTKSISDLSTIGLSATSTTRTITISETIKPFRFMQSYIDLDASGFTALSSLEKGGTLTIGDVSIDEPYIIGYYIGPEVQTIGDNFLKNFTNFDFLDTSYGDSVESIGNYFMYGTTYGCGYFRLEWLATIGGYCNIRGDQIDLDNLSEIPNWATIVGGSINIPQATSIGNNVVISADGRAKVNGDITLTLGGVVSIGNSFNVYGINVLNFPNLETIGNDFFSYTKGVSSSAGYEEYSIKITWPKLTTIGDNFMSCQQLCNVSFDLPSTVVSIGEKFLNNLGFCHYLNISPTQGLSNHTPMIKVDCPPSVVNGDEITTLSSWRGDNINGYDTSSTTDCCPIYATGINFRGTYAEDWAAAFPSGKWEHPDNPGKYYGRKIRTYNWS